MQTVRTFIHPLTGDAHKQAAVGVGPSKPRRAFSSLVVGAVLSVIAVVLLGVGLHGCQQQKPEAVEGRTEKIEYEPLSDLGQEGGQDCADGNCRARGVLSRLRLRNR
jgi:hypothetical protein